MGLPLSEIKIKKYRQVKAMKKAMKMVNNLVTYILVLVMLMMAFFVLSSKASGGEPQALGYQIKTVLSGSMEPTFQTGSLIAVKSIEGKAKTELAKGDIITFQESENKLVTHRITEVRGSNSTVSYVTKGDNNKAEDMNPVLAANVTAKYSGYTIPYVGYFIHYASTKAGSALLLIVPGVLLLLYAAFTIFQAIREIDPKPKESKDASKLA